MTATAESRADQRWSGEDGGQAGDGGSGRAHEVVHGAMRGIIGAAAMSGMRELTVGLGLVEEPPPRAIARQKSKGIFHLVPRKKRHVAVELMHWGYGAAAGVVFALLPEGLRKRRWFGPVYGVALWASFEAVQAPLMGLKQAQEARPVERAALVADHLLYGFVLSEMRARPQE
jgi:hypothetical protein